jgi:hypothetical protein
VFSNPPGSERPNRRRPGLYRIAGVGEAKKHYGWRPTGQTSFHVPQAFGTIRLD